MKFKICVWRTIDLNDFILFFITDNHIHIQFKNNFKNKYYDLMGSESSTCANYF